MGIGLQVIGADVANPSTTITAAAALTGDSLTVLNYDQVSSAELLQLWTNNATGGTVRVHSPRMHDNINGIEVRAPAASSRALLDADINQRLFAQDTLTVATSGGTGEHDQVFLLNYYDNIGGIAARLSSPDAIRPRVEQLMGVVTTQGTGVAAGAWSAGVLLNSTDDQFKANRDYALLGYTTLTEGGAFGIQGPDTGNVKVGGPLTADPIETRRWFVRLSERSGKPCIPVINAANKAATTVFCAQAVTSTAVVVVLHFALLSA